MKRSGSYAAWVFLFKISPLIILSTFLFSPAGYAQLADSPWPKYRKDLNNTGRTTYVGPASVTLKWSYVAAGNIANSLSLGVNSRVYFGGYGDETRFYCLNSNGHLAWTYVDGVTWASIRSTALINTSEEIYFSDGSGSFFQLILMEH